ncbi:hypothetical protein F5I97DRAFT_1931209 [Phlebopus sp. FC_14]|nr:hypothetical protein F5I97DRAFT_1931209 [Phlebopus sp. FC_14]
MATNTFSLSSNVFGIIVGGVSLITLAFGFHLHLPSNRIKHLQEVLDETEQIFRSAVQDGLLPQHEFTSDVERHLYKLRDRAMALRRRVYCATTWVQDCKLLFRGVSSEIGKTRSQLKKLRAVIITSSEAQRRNISVRRDAATSSASSPSHVVISMDSNVTTDNTDGDASSIPTLELTESTVAESSERSHEAESFTTAEDLLDAVSNLSTQPTGRFSSYWTRIWKHGKPGTRDLVHEVKVEEQIPGTKIRAIRLGGYYVVPVQTVAPEALP